MQFKKFGFFTSKKDEEAKKNSEKFIKCLYKNETEDVSKHHKNKSRRSREESPLQKYVKNYIEETERYRYKQKKRSSESAHRKHKKTISASETELYYIPPEEIKKYRRKQDKQAEQSPETRRKHIKHDSERHSEADTKKRRTEMDVAKLIKEQKRKSSVDSDNQWITKKDIFKFISDPKNLSTTVTSDVLKKYFVFQMQGSSADKTDVPHDKNNLKKVKRPPNVPLADNLKNSEIVMHYSKHHQSRSKSCCSPRHLSEIEISGSSSRKHKKVLRENEHFKFSELPIEKIKRKSSKKESERVMTCPDSELQKDSDRTISQAEIKRKRKPSKKESERVMTCQDSELQKDSDRTISQAEIKRKRKPSKKESERVIKCHDFEPQKESHQTVSEANSKKKSKDRVKQISNNKEVVESSDSHKHKSREKEEKRVNNVNSKRHRHCLVKNTFPIVEIPALHPNNLWENKKKSKLFKKYYKYIRNGPEDDDDIHVETSKTFSDSHKMYQDMSEQSFDDSKKKHKHRRTNLSPVISDRDLKVVTHVSAITINPRTEREPMKASQSRDSRRRNKSKIPVLRAKKSKERFSTLKSYRQKIIDAISPPRSSKESDKEARETSKKDEAVKSKTSSVKFPKGRLLPSKVVHSKCIKERCEAKSSKVKADDIKIETHQKITEDAKEINPSKIPSLNKNNSVLKKGRLNQEDSKISKSKSRETKEIKKPEVKKTQPLNISRTDRVFTKSTLPVSRRFGSNSVVGSQKGDKSPEALSKAGSSEWSKSSKKSKKTPFSSKSDTRMNQDKKENVPKKYKSSATKASFSNSTFGDKSFDSYSRATSFLVTKSYKDDDKMNRWQKQKHYSDQVRKKNQKPPVHPQVVEVRYLTVTNEDTIYMKPGSFADNDVPLPQQDCKPESEEISEPKVEEVGREQGKEDVFENDLPTPCLELVETDKFNQLFDLPLDKALHEILHENYNFLKKDFSSALQVDKSLSNSDDDEMALLEEKINAWYDFKISDDGSISEISCCEKVADENKNELHIDSDDHIVDSCSAPCSEESGYSTIKSRTISKTFFEKPDIKALLKPPVDSTYCFQIQLEHNSSNECGVDIRSIESKSMQTYIECSQKSIQIKMSEEEEIVKFNFESETPGVDASMKSEEKEQGTCQEQTKTTTKQESNLNSQEENKKENIEEQLKTTTKQESGLDNSSIVNLQETSNPEEHEEEKYLGQLKGETQRESDVDNSEEEKIELEEKYQKKQDQVVAKRSITEKRVKRKSPFLYFFTACVSKSKNVNRLSKTQK